MPEEKVKKTVAKKVEKKETPKVTVKEAGISVSVYDLLGKATGKMALPKEIFAEKENPTLLAQAVRVYLVNQRRGTSSTKTRGEVNGTTKKIYRQKGTGRARHGAAKAPIFVGGGITFGPKPREFALSMPKKMKRKALFSALSAKVKGEKIAVVDWEKATGKTKEIAKALKNIGLKGNIMVVVAENTSSVNKATRNIKGVTVKNSSSLTTYDVMKNTNVLLVKDAVESMKKTFLGGNVA